MSSNYPGGYDNLPARTDASPATPNAHADDHTALADGINAIQAELGLDPAGASATVKARLDALDTTVAGKEAAGVAAALVDDLSGVSNASAARGNLGLGTMSTQAASNVSITGGSITGITDLAIADGGTGASDAGTARTNLGLGTSSVKDAPATGNATSSQVVLGSDTRLTDARTPSSTLSHASTHSSAGSDPITIANTQVTGLGTMSTQAASNVSITGGSVTGITDLAIADGGTGASDAGTARTNLGLAIGTDVQAYDADLGAVAALSTNGLVARTGAGTAATRTITGGTGFTVTNGDGVAGDPTLALDQDLQDVAGLTRNKGDLIVGGASAWLDLAVGGNGTMLFADSAETTGVKWVSYRSQALKFNTDDYWLMSHAALGTGYSATTTGSSPTNSNNVAIYCPFSISEEISIKSLAIHLVTANAGASAVVRLGIYNADTTTGRPSTVVVDGGTVSINSTATLREVTFTSVTLKPGFYFYVLATQSIDTAGTNPQFSGCGSSASGQGAQETTPALSNNLYPTWTSSSITGAFASSPTVTVTRGLASKIFHVWAKVA